jgi:hypothetical protein
MKKRFIVMNSEDNYATSLEDISKGEELGLNGKNIVKINHNISFGHKFALKDINTSEFVKKYGQIIGIIIDDIKKGDWIHTHNIKSHYLERVANE